MIQSGGEPVHLLDRVVHLVEPPQERHVVRRSMRPVLREVGEEHGLEKLWQRRLARDRRLHRRVHQPLQRDGTDRERNDQARADEHVVHDEVHRVGAPADAASLAGM